MERELKHLVPYLPYKLKVLVEEESPIIRELRGIIDEDLYFDYNNIGTDMEGIDESYCRPILHPLSDYKDVNSKAMNELNCDIIDQITITELANRSTGLDSVPYGVIKIMSKAHIDFQRLIENKLAIDINKI